LKPFKLPSDHHTNCWQFEAQEDACRRVGSLDRVERMHQMVEKYFMESKSLFFLPGSNGSNKPLKDFNLQFDQFGYSTGNYGKNTTRTFGNLGNGGFDQSRSSVAPKAVCQTSLFIPYHPLIVYLPT